MIQLWPFIRSQGHSCLTPNRSFLAVNKEGKFLTGRQLPKLTTVVVTLDGNKVTLYTKDTEKMEFDLENVTKAGKVTDAMWVRY